MGLIKIIIIGLGLYTLRRIYLTYRQLGERAASAELSKKVRTQNSDGSIEAEYKVIKDQ